MKNTVKCIPVGWSIIVALLFLNITTGACKKAKTNTAPPVVVIQQKGYFLSGTV